jgi:hypothetical protein
MTDHNYYGAAKRERRNGQMKFDLRFTTTVKIYLKTENGNPTWVPGTRLALAGSSLLAGLAGYCLGK